MRTIHITPDSVPGPVDEAELASLRKYIALDFPAFDYDPDYISFIQHHRGGKPIERYFSVSSNTFPIDYFLNFQSDHTGVNASLNVNAAWSAIEDRLSPKQFPFALLPSGDFLCFDHSQGTPAVVLWHHELSEEDAPYTEPVASNFSEFLQGLRSEA